MLWSMHWCWGLLADADHGSGEMWQGSIRKKSLVMNELFDLEILHQCRQYCCLKKNNRQRWQVPNSWQDVQRFKTMLVAPRCIVVMVQLSTWFSVAQGTKWKMDGKQLKSLDRIGKCLTRRTWNVRRCCFLSGEICSPCSSYSLTIDRLLWYLHRCPRVFYKDVHCFWVSICFNDLHVLRICSLANVLYNVYNLLADWFGATGDFQFHSHVSHRSGQPRSHECPHWKFSLPSSIGSMALHDQKKRGFNGGILQFFPKKSKKEHTQTNNFSITVENHHVKSPMSLWWFWGITSLMASFYRVKCHPWQLQLQESFRWSLRFGEM